MKLPRIWVHLALVSGISATASAIQLPRIETFANAHYQGLAGGVSANAFQFPAANLPVTVTSRSYAPVSGFAGYGRTGHSTLPDIQCAWDDSDALATATVPGIDGAYARVGGYSFPGGPPDDLRADANVKITSNWIAQGAAGTTPVDLFFFLDGFLYTSKNSGLPQLLEAGVSVSVDVTSSLGTTRIFEANSVLNFAGGFSTTFATSNAASSANWTSSWANNSSTLTSTNGVDILYELNYVETIDDILIVPTNEVFQVDYILDVAAYNGEGPSELFATSDLSNTSDFALTSNTAGVTLTEVNLVPEPATIAILGIGCLSASRRLKRS